MSIDGPVDPSQGDESEDPWSPDALSEQTSPSIRDGISELKTGAKRLSKGVWLLVIAIIASLFALILREEIRESDDEDLPEIVKTPGVLGGKPRIEGRRISVLDVAELLIIEDEEEEVADQLEIEPNEVRAAKRYWRENEEEIEELRERRVKKHEELVDGSEDPAGG